MKALIRCALLALISLSGLSLSASLRPNPGHVEVYGEFLYLHPLYDQSYFVLERSTNTINSSLVVDGERIDNAFGWHPAFRIGALYTFASDPGKTVEARWTHLNAGQEKTVAGLLSATDYHNLQALDFFRGNADSDISTSYNAVDLLYGQALFDSCPFAFVLQVGLQYTTIRFHEELFYNAPFAGPLGSRSSVSKHSNFWGLGPEMGFDATFGTLMLFGWNAPASLTASLKGALLVANSTSSFDASATTQTPIHADSESQWRFVPTWDARLGFSYEWCFRCFGMAAEIGYEVIGNRDAIQTTYFESPTNNRGQSYDDYSSLDFHGPYASLCLSF